MLSATALFKICKEIMKNILNKEYSLQIKQLTEGFIIKWKKGVIYKVILEWNHFVSWFFNYAFYVCFIIEYKH